MSGEVLLSELFEASFEAGRREAQVVEMYQRRLLALGRPAVYPYLRDHRQELLACLSRAFERARFVLELWALAPPEDWGAWAEAMPSHDSSGLDVEAAAVVAHMLTVAPTLEPAAIRSISEHLDCLEPMLGRLEEERARAVIAAAADESLERHDWWATDSEVQIALHELIRAVATKTPAAAAALRETRSRDLLRAPLEEPAAVRSALGLAHDLDSDTYTNLAEALPAPKAAEQPALYAEVAVAKAVLQVRNPDDHGGTSKVRVHLNRIKTLVGLGEFGPQWRELATACLDLRPTPAQVETLSRRLGGQPGDEALAALVRWRAGADRFQIADALARMVRPHFDARRWVAVLSDADYVEAPVVRALGTAFLAEGTRVEQRQRMASMVRELRLRTQRGRDQIADLIVKLLDSKTKANLSVALCLCEGLGPDHRRETKLKRAFERYSQRHSHKFTPTELEAIAAVGLELPDKYLSKGARKRSEEIVAEGLRRVRGLGKFVGLGGG